MKLLIAAALLVAPAFADCCSYERVRAEARRAQAEATRAGAAVPRRAEARGGAGPSGGPSGDA